MDFKCDKKKKVVIDGDKVEVLLGKGFYLFKLTQVVRIYYKSMILKVIQCKQLNSVWNVWRNI